MTGTYGAALVDGLIALDQEYKIIKKRFSPFFQTYLDMILRRCVRNRVKSMLGSLRPPDAASERSGCTSSEAASCQRDVLVGADRHRVQVGRSPCGALWRANAQLHTSRGVRCNQSRLPRHRAV